MDELHNSDIRDLEITNITQEYDTYTNVTIVFKILMFQDRGKYMCIVDYTSAATNGSVSFTSKPEIVSVECKYNFLHIITYIELWYFISVFYVVQRDICL